MLKTITKLAKKEKRIPALSAIWVKNGMATWNNCDMTISAPCPYESGIWHAEGFDKGFLNKAEIDAENMPGELKTGEQVNTAAGVQIDNLAYVAQGISTEETRYYLNGVFFQGRDMVATNGHILFLQKMTADIFGERGVILPRMTVKAVLDIAKELKEDIFTLIVHDNDRVTVKIGPVTIVSKVIDGAFPAYERVIPKGAESRGHWSPEYLKAAMPEIKILAKIAGSRTPAIKLTDNKIIYGGKDWILKGAFPEKYEVGFNAEYLAMMPAGEWSQDDNFAPALFAADNGRLAVCMPMRV